jgi:ATP-dependent protease ClpP protease subunit
MATPRIVIDRDISPFDPFAETMGEGQPVFSSSMMEEFLTANAEADSIEVEIRSNGGSTSEARIIFDQLLNSGKTVKTIGYKVHSSAVVIFLAGSERLISENADMLIHPVWVDAFNLPWQLTAEDLQDFANEINVEEEKLKGIYAQVIGDDKMEEVGQLMADSTTLSAADAIRLGFATGKVAETITENKTTGRRALAYTNKFATLLRNQKSEDMKSITELLKNLADKVDKLTNSDTDKKNASEALSEGGALYFDGETLGEGTAVFLDEAMEEVAPDGSHVLADGRTVTVAEGVVTAVEAADAPETETENKALKNEVAEIKANVATLVDTVNKMAGAQATMNAKVVEFQNKAFGDKGNPYPNGERKPATPKTIAERVAAASK